MAINASEHEGATLGWTHEALAGTGRCAWVTGCFKFREREEPRKAGDMQGCNDSSSQSWFAHLRIGKGRCGEAQARLEGVVVVKMSRKRPVRGVGQNMMSLLVQIDLPPTEIFTKPKSSTARDLTCLALLPSSFTQYLHSSSTEKPPSWLSAHNLRTPTSRCKSGANAPLHRLLTSGAELVSSPHLPMPMRLSQ